MKNKTFREMNVLFFDIETSPLLSYHFGLWDQNIGLNCIKQDWYVMSWAAKWLGDSDSKVMYADQEGIVPQSNDKVLLQGIWDLLDKADVVIGQNSKSFDVKKLNARFVQNGMPPVSSFRQIDTLLIARKHFKFTSNKLAYMTDKLCTKYKKLDHGNFSGMSLWIECINDNPKAWKEMKKYNKYDVLSLEELYHVLIPFDNSLNFDVYHNGNFHICKCGSKNSTANGYFYSNTAKFQKFKCDTCGHETRSKHNLLSKEKKASLVVDSIKK